MALIARKKGEIVPGKPVISIIDDDTAIITTLEDIFEEIGFQVVRGFANLKDIIKKKQDQKIVVIIDFQTSNINEILECNILSFQFKNVIKIGFHPTPDNLPQEMRNIFDYTLSKPYSVSSIIAQVNKLINNKD